MKLKVFDGSPTPNDVLALRLIQVSEREVMLAVVDRDGECLLDPDADEYGGGVLTISDGYIFRSPAVSPSLGFKLDNQDMVMLSPWAESVAVGHSQRYGGKRASFRAIDGESLPTPPDTE